jgi:hypothetical protein
MSGCKATRGKKDNKRADYGMKIVSQLAAQLTGKYGRSFALRNLRRMMQFAEQFSDFEIVSMASTQFYSLVFANHNMLFALLI